MKKRKTHKAAAAKSAPGGELLFTLDPRADGLEPLLGAAYLLTDRAYARLEGDKTKSLRVILTPKKARDAKARAALKADFLAELASQRLRWAVTRNNQPVREYVAEHALSLAAEYASRAAAAAAAASSVKPAEPAADQLSPEQKSEIERLIAEVEAEISLMNKEQTHADPAGKTLSWEAANAKKGPAA